MTVIQLEGGELWVHSPVHLDEPLKDALKKLGVVKYIISPNYEHLKYAGEWSLAYPDAFMWGCPGLIERLPEIKWTGEIPSGIRRPGIKLEDCWDFDTIIPLHLDIEVNPFIGFPFFNEVIFYHVPSKTLLTTDLFWNYPPSDGVPNSQYDGGSEWELAPSVDSIPLGTQLWKQAMDKIYLPFYKNFMVKDRTKYNEIVKVLLDEWDINILVPAHGDIIRGADLIQTVMSLHLKLK